MKRSVDRRTRPIVLIGSGPEAALVASLLAISPQPPDVAVPRDARAVWVDSADSLVSRLDGLVPGRVIVETPLAGETLEVLQRMAGRSLSIDSTTAELERYFGRVSPDPESEFIVGRFSEPAVRVWRLGECLISLAALFPVFLLIGMLSAGLLLCGTSQLFHRRVFVGLAERQISMLIFDPRPPRQGSHGGTRAFVAASLTRQARRLHLAYAPALFSVLRGDIALVGPALMTPADYDQLIISRPVARLRTLVPPGLVSLSQVRLGRVRSTYDQQRSLEYDLFYIKYRTLTLNFRIVARAVSIVTVDFTRTIARMTGSALRILVVGPVQWTARAGSSAARLVAPTMPTHGESDLRPTLIIGAGAAGTQLVRDLQSSPNLGLWPVAFVDDDLGKLGSRICGVPVLGGSETIDAIVRREQVEQIILAIPSAGEVAKKRLTDLAHATGKSVRAMPSLRAMLDGAAPTDLVSVLPSDLLGRPVVEIDPARAKAFLGGKRVLVTGAAGSIGREVVLQALRGAPQVIYGLDINESDLYDLQQDLRRQRLATEFIPVVGSVTDQALVERTLARIEPHVIFHAAAYKHVPLMEEFPMEAVRTNIVGTWNVASAAARFGVERFVLVSTDKAVRPSSVMGATKRLAELVVREISATTNLSACAVRFGNVLASRGSVIPLFERQIAAGGPVTVTDKEMTRYFMTIPEAAGLIIEAGAFGDRGVVYMLDMDEPVKIVDVAERLIRLKGLRPGVDIAIDFTGLRPGEKMFEELALDFEQAEATLHPKIRILADREQTRTQPASQMIEQLLADLDGADPAEIRQAILRRVQLADRVDLKLVPPSSSASVERKRSVS
jgi:FlaA1/EpsC-like NDP-sugar epimerase